MGGQRARGGRRALHLAFIVGATLVGGCNSVFGIHEGTPPPPCYDPGPSPLLIDDMEDGVGDICNLGNRQGYWYTVGDGTSTTLTPAQDATFAPTLIPGGRGSSHYAARFTGSGFTDWGALMGFNLDKVALMNQTVNASSTGGITFWMKNDVPVSVEFLIPDTVLQKQGGDCVPNAGNPNCSNSFSFEITAPNADWVQYQVPFAALTQQYGGTATWNPQLLLSIQFAVGPGAAFDVWVDDISFYYDSTGLPTCTDPAFPLSCPAGNTYPAACRLAETDCSAAAGWCSNPLLIDDMEDGNGVICNSGGRQGSWWTGGDGPEGTLSPAQGATFTMAPIPGGRGDSRMAARMAGSGFTSLGAWMGLNLDSSGGVTRPYDASAHGGVTFWMKTDALDVGVELPISATTSASDGGSCIDSATTFNCENHFSFFITPPKTDDWIQYHVPFSALWQAGDGGDANGNVIVGSATWDPTSLFEVQFSVHTEASFELWIDDLSFYDDCSGEACLPTCTDPNAPVACPATGSVPAGCWAARTDCSMVTELVRPNFTLNSVWGSGADDVWAVGMASQAPAPATILHWNGSAWSSFGTEGVHTLWGVWGSAPDDVWAVGDFGTIVHWDGSAWSLSSAASADPLNSVWGGGRDDVWAVGLNGVILHWDGASWAPSASGTTQDLGLVWGTGPGDAWTVGGAGTILHWDGSSWSPVASSTAADLSAVWGSGPNDVWAVGSSGAIVHWDGSAWSTVPSGTTQIIVNVWGTGPNDVWAAGYAADILHWDGSAWSTAARTGDFVFSLWGSGASDVWAVGTGVQHWDGSTWTPLNPNPTPP
jgi:hypothetical protein